MELLAERLRVTRKAKGDTQQDVADYMGVRVGIVSLWERGKARPMPANKAKLAEYLGIDLDELEDAARPLYEVIEGIEATLERIALAVGVPASELLAQGAEARDRLLGAAQRAAEQAPPVPERRTSQRRQSPGSPG